MRTPFIAGNWKMNLTTKEIEALLTSLKSLVADVTDVDMAVCPPAPYLGLVKELVGESQIQLGAQNMCWEDQGAFTGETSSPMLKDIGCDLVILGHSERRHIFGETDAVVNKKMLHVLVSGIKPIVCAIDC